MNIIRFHATSVDTFRNEFMEDFVVFNICFEESDPEAGGESWNFQRALGADGAVESLGEEDEGVCIVKEIQQETFYEQIESVILSRTQMSCRFCPQQAARLGFAGLDITFDISDKEWDKLVQMADFVFVGKDYFKKTTEHVGGGNGG